MTDTSDHVFVLSREARSEPFVAKVGDTTLTMPHISDLDQFRVAELYATEGSDLEFLTGFFALAMGDDVQALRDLRLTRGELLALYQAYLAHGGTTEGESPASSD